MSLVTGKISTPLALKPIHVGFLLSANEPLNQLPLCQESMCWSRTTEDGQQMRLAKQRLYSNADGEFSFYCPDKCVVEIAVYHLGYMPWIASFNDNQLKKTCLDINLVAQPARQLARVEVEQVNDYQDVLLKAVDLSLLSQPDLPEQRISKNGSFFIEHLAPDHQYGFALFIPDGGAKFHSATASPETGETVFFSSRSKINH